MSGIANIKPKRKLYLTIIALFLFLYIIPLGVRPILIPDESRYAEIPREMIESGDWVVPRLNGIRYFEKPVMGYWLNALSIKLFGENAFAVRFPSAMATGFSALILFLLVRRFGNESSLAMSAVLIFLTCFAVYGAGTFNILDNMLTMFVTASMTSFFFAINSKVLTKKRQGFFLLFGIFCGMAFLIKGFLAFAIPVVVIIPFMLWERRFKELFIIPWFPIVGAVLVILPWAVMIHNKEPDFWHFFIWNEHIKRFLSESAQHHESFWYYLELLPVAALPWTFLFPAVIIGLKKAKIKTSIDRYILCWFLFPLLFFSISKGKILTYILPCFVPLAILVSKGLHEYFEAGGKKAFNAGGKVLAFLMVVIATALVIVQINGFNGFKPYHQTWKWAFAVISLLTFMFILLLSCRKEEKLKKIVLYAVSPMFIMFSAQFILPDLTLQRKDSGDLLLRNAKFLQPDTILISDEGLISSVCWYLHRSDVYLLEVGGELDYGLTYEDASGRLIDMQSAVDLIKRNRGKIILLARVKNILCWRDRLPKPVFQDDSGPKGFVLWRY